MLPKVNTKHVGPLHQKTTYRRCGGAHWENVSRLFIYALSLLVIVKRPSVGLFIYFMPLCDSQSNTLCSESDLRVETGSCPAVIRGPTKWHIRTKAQKIPCYPYTTSEQKNRKFLETAQREGKWLVFSIFLLPHILFLTKFWSVLDTRWPTRGFHYHIWWNCSLSEIIINGTWPWENHKCLTQVASSEELPTSAWCSSK